MLEFIKADIEIPPGVLIFEDPPQHTIHRGPALPGVHPAADGRRWSPRSASSALGPWIRSSARAASTSSPTSARRSRCGRSGCCSASPRPTRKRSGTTPTPRCAPSPASRWTSTADDIGESDFFADYIDWRADHPSDDLMTELLQRRVRGRDRNDAAADPRRGAHLRQPWWPGPATRPPTALIGWMGKVLAEHPDQRRELVEDPSLVPNAIEELLRFEPPGAPRRPLRDHGRRAPRRDRAGRAAP